MPGIGTLRQYHARPSNITTIKDVTEEVTDKTTFVVAVDKDNDAEVKEKSLEEQRFDNESPAPVPDPLKKEPAPADNTKQLPKNRGVPFNKNT